MLNRGIPLGFRFSVCTALPPQHLDKVMVHKVSHHPEKLLLARFCLFRFRVAVRIRAVGAVRRADEFEQLFELAIINLALKSFPGDVFPSCSFSVFFMPHGLPNFMAPLISSYITRHGPVLIPFLGVSFPCLLDKRKPRNCVNSPGLGNHSFRY